VTEPGDVLLGRAEIERAFTALGERLARTGWDSAFDLRRRKLTLAEAANEIIIPDGVAAALRGLQLPDTDCERLVFRIRARNDHAILAATDDLAELIGFVTAEANNESSRRRQQRLDAAFDVLKAAAQTRDGW
jgi:hypothetical protein